MIEWSANHRGCYLHNTQHKKQTTHNLNGIRNHDSSHQTAADLNFTLHGHWKWQPQIYIIKF